jgi:hypothetical protein
MSLPLSSELPTSRWPSSWYAQACLDLFEKDCGRRANTALDIRVWADVQVPENLQFRILRRLRTAEVWTEACKRIWNDIPASLASRPPMGQRISLSLAEAAKTTGLSESTILGAIEDGRIAGMKDILNGWYVERAQLRHVFPPAPAGPAKSDTDNRRALDAAALMLGGNLGPCQDGRRQAATAMHQLVADGAEEPTPNLDPVTERRPKESWSP